MNEYTVAVSREYGSGGREIASRLATELGIGFYDKSIIKLTAEKSGLSSDYIEKSEEKTGGGLLFNLRLSAYSGVESLMYYETPTSDRMFIAQSEVIRELSARESCVILGRCADYVLREKRNLIRVFIYADLEERARRAVESYGLPDKNPEAAVRKADKARGVYYKYYTNRVWGAKENFDLAINSSFSGVDGAVAVIKTLLREKGFAK
ncbi:MAG: cytidylate kinase-like family protein [Oscillospiraceae bacterium]|jgi:cytidylate kinase|nr:cytidylate kinase-like family protein [Oscillospiraceae bacterium]